MIDNLPPIKVNQFKTNEQEAVETERAKIDTQFKAVGDEVQQRVDEVTTLALGCCKLSLLGTYIALV